MYFKNFSYVFFCMCLFVVIYLWRVSLQLDSVDSLFGKKRWNAKTYKDTKHILLWSHNNYFFDNKNKLTFPSLNCSNRECVFTERNNLPDEDYTKYDAVVFDEYILNSKDRPLMRNQSQIYIFNAMESSYSVPACEIYNDDFFNWTLTYRLDSDFVWSYFLVRKLVGTIVAPKAIVKWHQSSAPINGTLKSILTGKSKAVAWLVSHCRTDSLRDEYLTRLQEHLFHFALKIDVYGNCNNNKCPNDNCDEIIKKDYYFYVAFENSFAKDYVTEKVLHGYNNYAVPIVYGGANYNRFLPPNSYINAREMHPYNLAFTMYQAIQTPALYEKYFKWTNVYTISDNYGSDHPLCALCNALHNKIKYTRKDKFRLWWNGRNGLKWCLSKEYWNETANVNIDAMHIFNLYSV